MSGTMQGKYTRFLDTIAGRVTLNVTVFALWLAVTLGLIHLA
jgi:hypothetical protein